MEPICVSGILHRTRDYSFMESRYGKRHIILYGYSFRRRSAIPGKSYWHCCVAECSAKGTLQEDGIFQLTSLDHNHEPNHEKLKRQEQLVWLKKLALQVNVSGQELLQALDIKDNFKKNLDFIRACRKRDKNRGRLEPLDAGLNYKHKPTRCSEKEFLCNSGYTYRKDYSVNPRDEKCKYWKCAGKSCKGRAKTDGDGSLAILNPNHNHSIEEAQRPLNQGAQQPSKSDRLSQEEKIKSVSHIGVPNSTFCSDSDSFNLDKLMAATLDEDYCITPEIGG